MILHCVLLLSLTVYSLALSYGTEAGYATDEESQYTARLGNAGTTDAYPFQFPEILSIHNTNDDSFIGQGSLIATNMSITAASVLWQRGGPNEIMLSPDDVVVAGGSLHGELGTGRATIGSPTTYNIKYIFVHPGFAYYPVPKIFEKDIALLVPVNKFVLNQTDDGPYMAALPLAKLSANKTSDIKDFGVVAGWGKIESNSGTPVDAESDNLNFINSTFALQKKCAEEYANNVVDGKPAPYVVRAHTVCMNVTKGKGYCEMDAGAALRIIDQKTFTPYIVGIASTTLTNKCPPPVAKSNLYTRVAFFVNWIYSKGGPAPVK